MDERYWMFCTIMIIVNQNFSRTVIPNRVTDKIENMKRGMQFE